MRNSIFFEASSSKYYPTLSCSFLMGLKTFVCGAMIKKPLFQPLQFKGKILFKRGSLEHVALRVHDIYVLGQSKTKLNTRS